jgi:hypothetical protein
MKTTNNRMPTRTATTVQAYRDAGVEPTIAEMLAEPIVRTLMQRDAISDDTIVRVIAEARAQLAERRAA